MSRLTASLTLAAALALAAPAPAQEGAEGAIREVIQRQIEAFLADDFARAFAFASPAIKQLFRTPDNFGRMVREGYPMVWRPADIAFGELREVAGRLWQRVIVTDRSGVVHVLDYQMIPTGEGWQINGVHILRAPEVGA
jgi:hypothetical protein